jgi:hypothetical protein
MNLIRAVDPVDFCADLDSDPDLSNIFQEPLFAEIHTIILHLFTQKSKHWGTSKDQAPDPAGSPTRPDPNRYPQH